MILATRYGHRKSWKPLFDRHSDLVFVSIDSDDSIDLHFEDGVTMGEREFIANSITAKDILDGYFN